MSKSPIKSHQLSQQLSLTIKRQYIQNYHILYSICQKESDSGFFSNKRLLLLNTKDKSIGYCDYNDKISQKIPFNDLQNIPKFKKKVKYEEMQCHRYLYKKNSIQISCSYVQYNEKLVYKPDKWVFEFKNSTLADDWVRQIQIFKQNPEGIVLKKDLSKKSISISNNNNSLKINTELQAHKQMSIKTNKSSKSKKYAAERSELFGEVKFEQNIQIESSASRMNLNKLSQIKSVINKQKINQNTSFSKHTNINSNKLQDYKENTNQFSGKGINDSQVKQNFFENNLNVNYNRTNTTPHKYQKPFKFDNIKPPQSNNNNDQQQYETLKNIDQSNVIQKSQKNKSNHNTQKSEQKKQLFKKQITPLSLSNNKNSDTNIRFSNNNNNENHETKLLSPKNIKIFQISKQNSTKYHDKKFEKQSTIIRESNTNFDWNQQFYFSSNKIQTLMSFKNKSEEIIRQIIDEIPLKKKNYPPLHQNLQSTVYSVDQIIIKIIFTTKSNVINALQERKLKNQFKNYNYLMKSTLNQTIFKVPLCCLFEYKGIVGLAKANIKKYEQIQSSRLNSQLIKLQKLTKIKKQIFLNKQNVVLKYVNYQNNTKVEEQVIYCDQFKHFIPYDQPYIQQFSQLRQEFITDNQFIFSQLNYKKKLQQNINKMLDQQNLQISIKIKNNYQQILTKMESLEVLILSPTDLKLILHKYGINHKYIPNLYNGSRIQFLKKIFLSELAAKTYKRFLRITLQQELKELIKKNNLKPFEINSLLIQKIVIFLNDILTKTQDTDKIWKIIFLQLKKTYGIISSKDQIDQGYFLSAVVSKSLIQIDSSYFNNMSQQSHINLNALSVQFINKFMLKSNLYDVDIFQGYQQIKQILNQEPTQIGFNSIVSKLNLKQNNIPEYFTFYSIRSKLSIYLSNFIPIQIQNQIGQQYQHLRIYQDINNIPPSIQSIKLLLKAIKWAIKKKKQKFAVQLFEKASKLVSFWGGQFHPLLTEFYDFFALYYVYMGQDEEAITLSKNSLINIIKLIGNNSLAVAQKYYQLGNIYFKLEKKQDALNHYMKTKQNLQSNNKKTIPEYGFILLKISSILLNFGKISEVIELANECFDIFDKQKKYQLSLVQTYEILSRAYEITQQNKKLLQLGQNCGKKFNDTQDPKIFAKMFKISIYPSLKRINIVSRKCILNILQNIQILKNPHNYYQAFKYLKKKSQTQIISESFLRYLDKIQIISRQINNKQLLKKYRGMQTEETSQAQDFIILIEAISHLIDENFLIGILRQSQY